MPVAITSTSTSPALGPSRSTSWISSGRLGRRRWRRGSSWTVSFGLLSQAGKHVPPGEAAVEGQNGTNPRSSRSETRGHAPTVWRSASSASSWISHPRSSTRCCAVLTVGLARDALAHDGSSTPAVAKHGSRSLKGLFGWTLSIDRGAQAVDRLGYVSRQLAKPLFHSPAARALVLGRALGRPDRTRPSRAPRDA
jgi:hypothetical protein